MTAVPITPSAPTPPSGVLPPDNFFDRNQGVLRPVMLASLIIAFSILWPLGGRVYYGVMAFIVLFYALLDGFSGEDISTPNFSYATILCFNALLYITLPVLLWFGLCYIWYLGSGDQDLFGLGAAMKTYVGLDMFAVRDQVTTLELIVGGYCLGTIWGAYGDIIGHELTHRTWSWPAMFVGRWLLALTWDASFAIEHVYGHHVRVGSANDPATARRGENVYHFIVRSTVFSVISAWRLEAARLRRAGKPVHSPYNMMYRGWAMTAAYGYVFYLGAGWKGIPIFFAVALLGKCYLEAINYIEHYGIVRRPDKPVEPRHSWNCNQRVSSWLLTDLTRHSHHHAEDQKPFWELLSYPDAPRMPHGYLTMIYVALVPPLYFRLMHRLLADWDARHATPDEHPLIEEANRKSSRSDLMTSRAHLGVTA